ncbi:hypothetical protein [Massilia sp. CF038]|uniref:hypothetical protein n=1 Tax=Massilia sp. CF038 TaxID=1881045 RepID=UPI0011612F2D|nr:hypothetical protein [Massilia sp. CF038]
MHNSNEQFAAGARATSIGGGHYSRAALALPGAPVYRVQKRCAPGEFATVTQALAQWTADKRAGNGPRVAVIEIADSTTYHEAPSIRLDPDDELYLRAADMCRPTLRIFDYHSGERERIVVDCAKGARLHIDGVLIAGGALALRGSCAGVPAQVVLRHCTLVPGWETEGVGEARWGSAPSLVSDVNAVALCLDHCITGGLQLNGAGGALLVCDSIIDAGHAAGLAIADRQQDAARVCATILRSTVVGVSQLARLALAENAIFLGALLAGRRDQGLIRYCYLAAGSRTPARAHCQPDEARLAGASWQERQRILPRFRSMRYGSADYATLADDCAWEIASGADNGGAMGAYHSPQPAAQEPGPDTRHAAPVFSQAGRSTRRGAVATCAVN